MELIISSVKVIHVIVSSLLILVVLLQPGKGGDLGSIFGGGTSDSIFGSSGAVPFLSKVTRVLAVLFFMASLSLGYFAVSGVNSSVVTDSAPSAFEETLPAETTADKSESITENKAGDEEVFKTADEALEQAAEETPETDTAATDGTGESAPEEKPADSAAQ